MAPIFKKRKLNPRFYATEELTFDIDGREEYLTGFSKRKTARKEHARAQAIRLEKEERIKERAQLRDQRKQEIFDHVAAVNAELKKQNAVLDGEESEPIVTAGEDDEFSGFEAEPLPSDEEYIDEDKYTTVTVSAMEDEKEELDAEDKAKAEVAAKRREAEAAAKEARSKKKRPWAKNGGDDKKGGKKKFRYESKAERLIARQKQKTKSSKAAQARRTE